MKIRHTLENFFRLHEDKTIDFHLRIVSHGNYSFYIHPANVDGETWHFNLNGNALQYIYPSALEEENQILQSRIQQLETRVRHLEESLDHYKTYQLEQRDRGE